MIQKTHEMLFFRTMSLHLHDYGGDGKLRMSWFSGNRTFADFFKIVRSERTHSFKVRFLRHWQSIDPMVQEGREGVCFPPQAHRFDELHRVIPWKVARQQRLLLLLPVTSA